MPVLFIRNNTIYFHTKSEAEEYAKESGGTLVARDYNAIRYYGVEGVIGDDKNIS